jgi:hypothetical protein
LLVAATSDGYIYFLDYVIKSIILGIYNEYELSDFVNGFPIMVCHFTFWMEFFADLVLEKYAI